MPYLIHSHNKETLAVTISELVPAFYKSYNNLKMELYRYEKLNYGIKRVSRGGNGRVCLVDFDTLRPEIQKQLGDPRKKDNPLAHHFKFSADAKRFYQAFTRAGLHLSAEEQSKLVVNASVMEAVLSLEIQMTNARIQAQMPLNGLIATLIRLVENFNHYLLSEYGCSHSLPVSDRFRTTLKDFKNKGLDSLVKDAEGIKAQNARVVDPKTENLLNSMYGKQKNKPTATDIANQYEAFLSGYVEIYNQDTGELYNHKDYPAISKSTIMAYLAKWENKMATHQLRSGDRQKYMGLFKPHHIMQAPVYAGQMITVDDRQAPFAYDGDNNRPWFYIGFDVASHCITTVVWCKNKEKDVPFLIDFYRQMVRNYTEWGYNLPHELECESSLNSTFRNTLLANGNMFQETKMLANNARAKRAERFIGKLRNEIERKQIGWIARPFAKSEANEVRPGGKIFTPYKELINELLKDIETFNNMPHPSSQQSTTNNQQPISCWDYFCQNQHPDLKPTNWQGILPYIGYKTETSCKVGYVKLQGEKRAIALDGKIALGEKLIHALQQIEGKQIVVYWLDDNEGKLLKALVYHNERYVCELMSMPTYSRASLGFTEQDQKNLELQSSYVASVEGYGRKQKKALDNIGIDNHMPVTVNNNFQFPTVKRYQPAMQEEEVEVIPQKQEEYEYAALEETGSTIRKWNENFEL